MEQFDPTSDEFVETTDAYEVPECDNVIADREQCASHDVDDNRTLAGVHAVLDDPECDMDDSAIYFWLAVHENPAVRAFYARELAQDPNVHGHILMNEQDAAVLAGLAANPYLSPDYVRSLAFHASGTVRLAAVSNNMCPTDTLKRLVGDEVELMVGMVAQMKLDARFGITHLDSIEGGGAHD